MRENTAEAGWYPDVRDPTLRRYWDGAQWTDQVERVSDESLGTLESDRITTLPYLPGFTIRRRLGLVTMVTSASGTTARKKGTDALAAGAYHFMQRAKEKGANAVVGVQITTFGAGGGITNALGGDAVGVLIVGTAVWVDAEGAV